ncbi:MAG: MFS transporter [Paracoccaceae bacterium]
MNAQIFILMTCIALIGTNSLLLSPVLTDIAAGFEVNVGVTGRAIAGYSAGTAITAIWLGRSLDGFGLARALVMAMVVIGLAQFASAFSTGWVSLTFAQTIAGAGAGVAFPAIYGLTAEISPKGQESRYMSRVIFGWSIAMVAAVPIGAFLSDLFGWRQMLMIFGGATFLTLALAARKLPAPQPHIARVRLGRFAPLKMKGGMGQYALTLFFMMAFYGSYAYFGDHTRATFDITATAAGVTSLFYGIGFGVAVFAANLIDRVGRRIVLPTGLCLAVALLLTLAYAPSFPIFLAVVFVWGFANHFILNMIVVGLNALAPNNRGAVMGLYSGTTYAGAAIGVLLMGQVYESSGFVAVALTAAVLNLTAMRLALRRA